MFSVSSTGFVSRRFKTDKVIRFGGPGPGLGDAYPGVVEVPEDDQNDVGRGDLGQEAAVPAPEVQCGSLMYVVALGVCNVADSSSIFQTF